MAQVILSQHDRHVTCVIKSESTCQNYVLDHEGGITWQKRKNKNHKTIFFKKKSNDEIRKENKPKKKYKPS